MSINKNLLLKENKKVDKKNITTTSYNLIIL